MFILANLDRSEPKYPISRDEDIFDVIRSLFVAE